MNYSKSDIIQWLAGAYVVSKVKGNEVNFPCPRCDHESFYFNVKKQIGFCHRASCHSKITLKDMIDEIGYPPELAGYVPTFQKVEVKAIEMPKHAKPIEKEDPITHALLTRHVTWKDIVKFNIQQSEHYVYIPILDEGKLVQYISRRINRNAYSGQWFSQIPDGVMRYMYASGVPITNFIFGWEECKLWDSLILVENTFNAMWLRNLQCTTNFGSYLSDVQVDKIVHSNVKHVTFLWDEGANAQHAQKKLNKAGIPSKIINIKGQPDNYGRTDIERMLND